jgi:acetyl esterase/lipase
MIHRLAKESSMFRRTKRTILLLAITAFGINSQDFVFSAEIAPEPVLLWTTGAPGKVGDEELDKPSIRVYPAPSDRSSGTAVVVCPGGGYGALAVDHEGHQIAKWLNSVGVTGIVLKYRLGPRYRHPVPLQDAQRAIRYARANAERLGVSSRRIGIMGFSAGGHLASTAATHFDAGQSDHSDTIERVSCRPDFAILGYPVISFTEPFAHKGSARNLLGDNPSQELLNSLSNEKQVTKETPPTFLFHTGEDTGVPAENSVAFYLACRKAGVPAEMHIYRYGPHGVGLSPGDPVTFTWKDRLADWLRASGLLADVERGQVEGTIYVDGKPLKWGVVTFEPADSPFKPIAFAMVRNGKYSSSGASGPVIGNCRVKVTGLGDIVPQPTEDNFRRYESPIMADIRPAKNEINIDLKSE